jgi:hypothetical protein
MLINVPERYIQEILSEIGYPLIPMSSLKELASSDEQGNLDVSTIRQNFLNLVCWPALREYFKWFPITEIVEYLAEESFSFDFPDPETFTVVDARLNTAGFGVRDSVNPFVNNSVYRAINTTSSYGGGMWGTKYDYDYRQARIYDRMERSSLIDQNKAFRLDVDFSNRKVIGFSNILGKLVLTWGKLSEDFNDVQIQRLPEVIKLAKAYLLRYIGQIRGQSLTSLPNQFNYQLFLDRSKELEESVLTSWKSYSKIIIFRG